VRQEGHSHGTLTSPVQDCEAFKAQAKEIQPLVLCTCLIKVTTKFWRPSGGDSAIAFLRIYSGHG